MFLLLLMFANIDISLKKQDLSTKKYEKTSSSLILKVFPSLGEENAEQVSKSLKLLIKNRMIFSSISLMISVIVLIGGVMGTILLVKQNYLISEQTERLDTQNDLFKQQNSQIDTQNILISTQSNYLRAQNDLLNRQNSLLDAQNSLFNVQNKKVEYQSELLNEQVKETQIQSNLQDATRISSLVFLMSNILDEVSNEKRAQSGQNTEHGYRISDDLIGRIIALSRSLRPYKLLENKDLSKRLLSPERGQLFISLMYAGLDTVSLGKIFAEANFSYSDIGSIRLENKFLKNVNLSNSYFPESSFINIDCSSCNLTGAVATQTVFFNTNFDSANFSGAHLTGSAFTLTSFNKTIFSGASIYATNYQLTKFTDVDLSDLNMEFVWLKNVSFNNCLSWFTNFNGSKFTNVDFLNTSLQGSKYQNAFLVGTNFVESDLIETDFSGATVTQCNFKNVCVMKQEWLKIKEEEIHKNSDRLLQKYKVIKGPNSKKILNAEVACPFIIVEKQ
ncbi:pentapeptide repeat-containing protein [Flavilitoribacter nigricans]|uniref:pentapeptide repeat-containing protein n=1 Tax=Flavilitoribacter nigricans TaxID=70997 RepID=UPI0014755488|nr:pentapeptide repeat-containing protein [Flavilitoribacter nigricans]